MNNQVTVGNANVQINNPTIYNPDAIIGKYVVKCGTNVDMEIGNRTAKGLTQAVAAQDLFVRAVRTEESSRHKNAIIFTLCFNDIAKLIIRNSTFIDLLFLPILTYCFWRIAIEVSYFMITSIADRLGVNFYSV